LHAADQEAIFLIVKNGIFNFGMLRQNAVELGFDFRGPVVWVWILFAYRLKELFGLFPALLLGNLQDMGEVALDDGFDGLVAFHVVEVPHAEGHQGCRGEHDG
jgi:hypothetical protein